MNKPSRSFAKPLRDIAGKIVGETFTRQGFASAELVTRWTEIVGPEISAHSEPIKIQWIRGVAPSPLAPVGGDVPGSRQRSGTLLVRVEGPAAVEIQHLSNLICDRVNRFLGWRAIERIAFRQAPLRHQPVKAALAADAEAAARIAESLSDVADEQLRLALARLGAAVRRV